jgi:hypothetical protein
MTGECDGDSETETETETQGESNSSIFPEIPNQAVQNNNSNRSIARPREETYKPKSAHKQQRKEEEAAMDIENIRFK